MNKKEAIERIQELVATEEINKCLEILRQPITLTDFLGWEENAIYTDGNIYYKIQNGNLFFKTNGKIPQLWNLSRCNDNFNICYKLRQLEKVDIVEVQEQ